MKYCWQFCPSCGVLRIGRIATPLHAGLPRWFTTTVDMEDWDSEYDKHYSEHAWSLTTMMASIDIRFMLPFGNMITVTFVDVLEKDLPDWYKAK